MYQAEIVTSSVGQQPTCTLIPAENGCFTLQIQGKFPPQWLARLSSGLAAKGISILQGTADKAGPAVWEASFLLAPPAHASSLEHVDFLAMAQGGAAAEPAALRLSLHELSLRDDALLVEVKGADSIGFLVALLKLFAFYSLFPAQVSIDTPAGMVHDRFRLKGLGGSVPSAASVDGLAQELARLRH